MRPPRFWYGYYYARGNRFGDFDQVDAWTNLDIFSWAHFNTDAAADSDNLALTRMRNAAKHAIRNDRGIVLGLDIKDDRPWRRTLKKMGKRFILPPDVFAQAPWDNVALIDLSDEPPWTEAQQTAIALEARQEMVALGLENRPIGAVFAYTAPVKIVSQALDWVGLEAYLDPPGTQHLDIERAIGQQLTRQRWRLIRDAHDVVIVMQAYDRNGAWTDARNLRALQRATVKVAQDIFGDSVIGYFLFSYGRPGGTIKYPGLATIHQEIAMELGV